MGVLWKKNYPPVRGFSLGVWILGFMELSHSQLPKPTWVVGFPQFCIEVFT